jgi:hypothetical protein
MAKKDSFIKEGATPVFETKDGLRVFRMEDLESATVLEMQRLLKSAEHHASIANAPTQPIRYAVADGDLPQGADAVILRNAAAEQSRIIVIARGKASDRLLSICRFALFEDEHANPSVRGQKSILVWDDGRISE